MIHINVKKNLTPMGFIFTKIFFVQYKQAVDKVLGHLFLSFLPRIGVRDKLQQESGVFMKVWTPAPRLRGDKFTPWEELVSSSLSCPRMLAPGVSGHPQPRHPNERIRNHPIIVEGHLYKQDHASTEGDANKIDTRRSLPTQSNPKR